jgi:hypothetical protein
MMVKKREATNKKPMVARNNAPQKADRAKNHVEKKHLGAVPEKHRRERQTIPRIKLHRLRCEVHRPGTRVIIVCSPPWNS